MNVSIKKTHSFKNSNPIQSQNASFTPTKRFPISSPVSIISNAKIEITKQEITQNLKKPIIKSNGFQ